MKVPGAKSSMLALSGPEHAQSGFLQMPLAGSSKKIPEAQRGVVLSHHGVTVSNACLPVHLGQTGIMMVHVAGTSEIVLKNVDIQGESRSSSVYSRRYHNTSKLHGVALI